jgi:benzoylformate decarboxylase
METRTVRDSVLDVLRERRLTTLFANPGSTEVPFLAGLPRDLAFVLALHEASVVGIATGWAIAKSEPALAILHTTAGFGNAVGALATARVNRAPLVVLDSRDLPATIQSGSTSRSGPRTSPARSAEHGTRPRPLGDRRS